MQLRLLHLVVILLRIAQLHTGAGRLGERRLHGDDLLRVLGGLRGRFASEREHFRHMLDVLVAQFFRSRVFLGVVIAVGQSQPALQSLRDHHRAVLRVLIGSEAEERANAQLVQVRDFLQDVFAILQRVDAFEFICERRHARCVHRFFVHPARIKIAHLLQIRLRRFLESRFGGDLRCDRRGLLENLVQRVVIMLGQFVETSPARKLRWNRIPLYPAAIRVKVKIVLRFDGRIHVLRIERRRILFRLRCDGLVGACGRSRPDRGRWTLFAREFFFRRFGGRRTLRLHVQCAGENRSG